MNDWQNWVVGLILLFTLWRMVLWLKKIIFDKQKGGCPSCNKGGCPMKKMERTTCDCEKHHHKN